VFAGTKYHGIFRSEVGDAGGVPDWEYVGPEPLSVNGLLITPGGDWLYAATSSGFYRLPLGAR
jgi:hypothetical protein